MSACVKFSCSTGQCRTKEGFVIDGKLCPYDYLDKPGAMLQKDYCHNYLAISPDSIALMARYQEQIEKEPYADESQEAFDLLLYIAELEKKVK
jgi:hypothetical protein